MSTLRWLFFGVFFVAAAAVLTLSGLAAWLITLPRLLWSWEEPWEPLRLMLVLAGLTLVVWAKSRPRRG